MREVRIIDGYDMGFPGRTGTYVLQEEKTTLVETGPSPSVPHIIKGLQELGIAAEDVEHIVLTHIHLDHAGGAGLLLKECPNATIYVHERGLRHLADPSRLEKGARAVYGETFDDLFAPILPIPKEKLVAVTEGDTLSIGEDRMLTFYDTPGHAKHHLAIHDSATNGLFVGDTAGIQYHQTEDCGVTFYLPTTSPNQFDPEAMHHSIDRFEKMKPDYLFFGHYGTCGKPTLALEEVRRWIPVFVDEAEQSESMEEVEENLFERVSTHLKDLGVPDGHRVYPLLKLDMKVCAMGLVDYLKRKNR
ncbi:MBL fold metallo-hydrolase [Halobacillus litoralis]|uniref:MBL fold metallo-hydrolase n=1 Tax=Halobacillus litoralis TaxID=45668 RepID=UPI001CD70637|nr:MBL fold metallo-hydrolase [Halobacillus litoralis]MCA0972421.1 MBL fold metallo-hydrolase [Halobacillus litoralis]